MKTTHILSLVCFIICVTALTYTAGERTSTPKAKGLEHMLQAKTQSTANDTINQSTSDQHRYNKLQKVIHDKKGAYGGADLIRRSPKSRSGACSLLERPFYIFSATFKQIIIGFLVSTCLFRLP